MINELIILSESKNDIAYPKLCAILALNYHTPRLVWSDLEASTEHVAPWLLCCVG